MIGPDGLERDEVEAVVGMLAEHPDLWDFQVGTWDNDSETARFKDEGYQEELRQRAEAAHDASRSSASAASPRPT